MEKTLIIIFLLFILCGCQKSTLVSCVQKNNDDSYVNIDIRATDDIINSFFVRISYKLPYLKQEYKKDFDSQLDSSYHYENDTLIKEYYEKIDGIYSLSKTKDSLIAKRFYCE